jgi:hypothetical protein
MIPHKHRKQARNTCMTGSQNVRSASHDLEDWQFLLETNRNSRVEGVSCYQAQ